MLRLLDIEAVHLQSMFPAHTADETWIPQISHEAYILLTGDGNIRKGRVEKVALEESRLRVIFFTTDLPD